jgi:competence protein ComEC
MKNLKHNFKLYLVLIIVVCVIFAFYIFYFSNESRLTVAFLDVGQGDAIFIQAPGGEQMLIDGGATSGALLRELGKVMPFYDRSIDIVMATHADQDHIGGLPSVLERFRVGMFVRTATVASTSVYRTLLQTVEDRKVKTEIITAPENLDLGGGAEFDILFPDKDTAGWETNDSSIVGKLVYGSNSFLLTGDSPAKIETYLVKKYGTLLKSDVLKAGHHGSKFSSSELYLKTVLPVYTIISAGLNNRYGHPNQETLDRLIKVNSQVLKTMGQGSIIFKSDGQNLSHY